MRSIRTISITVLIGALLSTAVFGQLTTETKPRREKLLNGLRVLIFRVPSADKVDVKIRIHGGAAFDPQEREGTMKLLAESTVPNEAQRSFFSEDLGGSFDIRTTYDYIQVNASARPNEFLTMLEALATAVSQPTTDPETLAKLKLPLLEELRDLESDPKYIADNAAAARLLKTFPYGRPILGTSASIAEIDYADLIFAKDRLFTADNATVVISGNVDTTLAVRAAKRYFGAWLKSDKKIPSTFARPGEPDPSMEIISSPVDDRSEFRFITRGVAAGDAARHSAMILGIILDARIKEIHGETSFVRTSENVLPGSFLFGVSDWYLGQIKKAGDAIAVPDTTAYQAEILDKPISDAEFSAAKARYITELSARDTLDRWLDADTFKIADPRAEYEAAGRTSITNVREILAKIKQQPFTFVLVFSDKAAETPAEAAEETDEDPAPEPVEDGNDR